jgi:alpha-galactosidase
MNRALSDVASPALPPQRRGETAHRYVLGLYRVLEAITAANPKLLIEGCAGGGGRMDLGMLFYTSQYWTSDNTDAASRLAIQYGTSILFPPLVMGAHVSAVPNHQTGRSTPLAFRGAVAMSGNLGYELDLNTLSAEEREELRRQIGFYTAHRRLIQFGRFFRLRSPFEGPETAWIFVDPERKSALVFRFFIGEPDRDEVPGPLPLQGLDPQRRYQETHSGRLLAGRDLLTTGLALPPPEGKYSVQRVLLEAEA